MKYDVSEGRLLKGRRFAKHAIVGGRCGRRNDELGTGPT